MKKPEYRKGYTNISNDLMDNICKLPLNGTDIKVILCIFRYTAGVGRKSCKLSGSSIAKWGNCDLRAVKRALKKLQENKIIIRVNPIGYVPGGLAAGLAAVIDAGVNVKAELLQILGGYSYKESYGCLLDITI